jgi:hypothetical protein
VSWVCGACKQTNASWAKVCGRCEADQAPRVPAPSGVREPGFYWVRVTSGFAGHEVIVGEWSEETSGWVLPNYIREYSDDEVEVLSERLIPPTG